MIKNTLQQQVNGQGFYINYTLSGKMAAIYGHADKTRLRISFAHDEADNRIAKIDHLQNITTYYVNDADGNVLAIYDNNGSNLRQKEVLVYAADRTGVYQRLNTCS